MRIGLCVLAAFGGGCGGGGAGSGDDESPDARPMTTRNGYIFLQSYDAMNIPGTPTLGGNASAVFPSGAGFCVTSQEIGPCEVATCSTTGTLVAAFSAGTITITGALRPISLVPAADKSYAGISSTTASLFNGGETLTITAPGADVPAFETSLTMPSKTTITSPTKPSSASPYLIVNRSQDFSVSWTGGGGGQVQVALNGSGAERLFCKFPASAGTGKLPAAALATLPAGMGGFAMASIADTEDIAGDWAVEISAYFNAVWPDAAIVSGPTTFQ